MTRLANIEKAGYFPLPTQLIPLIASFITAPHGGRLLDPCVGKGAAAHELAQALNMTAYGVELSETRAAAAATLLGKETVLNEDFRALKAPPNSFNLLYENPPYLHTDNKLDGRAEYQWLRDTRPWLQPDGLLVWVVPRHMLRHRLASKYLASWFHNTRIYRFTDTTYKQFKQVIFFGQRNPKALVPDPKVVEYYKQVGQSKQHTLLPITKATTHHYTLPKLSDTPFYFRSKFVDPADAVAEAQQSGIVAGDAYKRHLDPQHIRQPLDPLMPLKIGHMNSIIAAGHLNNQLLTNDTETILIKGRSYKAKQLTEEAVAMPGGGSKVIERTTEVVTTSITTLTPDGELTVIEEGFLESFMTKWLPQLTDAVATQYQPRYQFDLNGYGPILDTLNQGRLIPMVGRPGLLPVQRHAIAALATQLKDKPDAYLIGEMGTGKTIMGIGVAACLHAKKTLVLCPPHLTKKWKREIEITWPEATAVILSTISDVDKFFKLPAPAVGVMKETTARAASGWAHAYNWFGPVIQKTRKRGSDLQLLEHSKHIKPLANTGFYIHPGKTPKILTCPTCGATIHDRNGLPITSLFFQRKQITCTKCKSPLYQSERRQSGSQHRGAIHHTINGALPKERHGYAKYPLATYILNRHKGKIDLLLADECHQFKARDSDRGFAFHRLVSASNRTLGLTGTIYGGKASTVFSLLYRTSPEMKRTYKHNDTAKWVGHYGILQEVLTRTYDEHGKQTGNAKSRTTIKELPGGSPAMLPWLLNRSVFVSLSDMGFALPSYEEVPVAVDMEPAQELQYTRLESQLREELKDRLRNGDKSLLAGYLQALLSLPDSPWRSKTVLDPRTEKPVAAVKALPADHLYPKEAAILADIQEELSNGRKVLLLCQQTNTLDITPQWQKMLANEMIKSAVLKAPPNRRESWIKKQLSKGVQVIISHPKRVETGLDLLEFPTIIWMGTEYSVYTVLQASRRSWRIGQDKPVKIKFYAYSDTLQEGALKLVAAKVAATLRINGDTIAHDSLAELDELAQTDMLTALANIVVGNTATEQSLQEAFSNANKSLTTANATIGDYKMEAELTAVRDPIVTSNGASAPSDITITAATTSNDVHRHPSPKIAIAAPATTSNDVPDGVITTSNDVPAGIIATSNDVPVKTVTAPNGTTKTKKKTLLFEFVIGRISNQPAAQQMSLFA